MSHPKVPILESGLRPSGSVERECSICHWATWFDPLSDAATVIPYICKACIENPIIGCTCAACNRMFKTSHRDLCAMGEHPRCEECKDIPPMQFAAVVYCWCCSNRKELKLATQQKHWDHPIGWQSWYHLCDEHAEDWLYDKPTEVQKQMMRKRGAKIIELGGGDWTAKYPEESFSESDPN